MVEVEDLIKTKFGQSEYFVVSAPNTISKGSNLYARIWPSSLFLYQLMVKIVDLACLSGIDFKSKETVIVEAGCGMGNLACQIAKLFQQNSALSRDSKDMPVPTMVGFDFVQQAVEISRLNASLHHLPESQVSFFQYNWHSPLSTSSRPDLKDSVTLLLGSDLLYMSNSIASLLRLFHECLHHNGMALLIDPGRGNEAAFMEYLQDHYCGAMECKLFVLSKEMLSENDWFTDSLMDGVENRPEKINILIVFKQKNDQFIDIVTKITRNS